MKIMNKNEKDFMENLTDLDGEAVEEIAEDYPALDENIQNRILKQCLRKSGLPDDDIEVTENTGTYEDDSDEDEISVSGIERYDRPMWHKYASSVAVMVVAIVGIASVVVLHGNLNNNDDFDISSPPVVSDVAPTNQGTEIVTGSYIDNGYVANGGIDYADQNDYQGIVVGGTTASEPDSSVDSANSGELPETVNNISTPEQNNQPQVTAPPATAPPVTEAPTAPPATEPPTEALSEVQKTFLNGRYFIVSDNGKYDGFEFSTDGTIKQFLLNIPDGFKRYTDTVYGYEIIENQFSYGYIGDEANWNTGTILNPNDGTTFSVQFSDGIYTFSTDNSILNTNFNDEIVIAGRSWYGYSDDYGERLFTFYDDGINGNYINTQDGTGLAFTYSKNGDEITFHMGDNETIINAKFIQDEFASTFNIQWPDGVTEYFYNGDYS